MIKQHKEEALKVVLYELLNASFSLFGTKQMNEQKYSLGEFFLEKFFFMNEWLSNYKYVFTETLFQRLLLCTDTHSIMK